MANDIRNLNPAAFYEIGKKRECAVASATGATPSFERAVNRLANELHPERQFLKVHKVLKLSNNCYSYILVPDESRGTVKLAYFQAGQYLSVKIEINGQIHNRPYSLISSPREALNGNYAIAVKATEDGFVSKYILDNWKVGTAVEVSAPMGNFTYEPLRDAKHVIGICGGSGITPFVSLAKAIADGDEDFRLTLLCGFKTMDDILFHKELVCLANRCNKLKCVFVLSDEERMGFEHGFLSVDLIKKYSSAEPYSLFICGPRAMHSYLDEQIAALNIEKKYIRHELYGEGMIKGADELPVSITVRMPGEEKTITATTAQTILRSLESNGITAEARCRSGECGFCRARLVSGEVTIPKESDRRRLADEPYGYIHPCCTYPKGDITIEIGTFK